MPRGRRGRGGGRGGYGQQFTAGRGATSSQPVYQYGQAREDAGFAYNNPFRNNDAQGWGANFDADLTASTSTNNQQATAASNGNSRSPAFSPSFAGTARSSNAGSNNAARLPLAQTSKEKADRMAGLVMEEALTNQASKKQKTAEGCKHDWQGDVKMCSCKDLNHVVE